ADGGDDDGGVMGCASGCTDPARPVCGADDTCRACDADSECGANGVCMIDGACADEAAILYVAPDGTGADCSVAAPCAITQAHASLSTTKYIVKLAPGSYAVATSLALDGQAPLIMF